MPQWPKGKERLAVRRKVKGVSCMNHGDATLMCMLKQVDIGETCNKQ